MNTFIKKHFKAIICLVLIAYLLTLVILQFQGYLSAYA